ncbi:MAG: glycosyltransferase family 4 protein [Candidatus Hydrothermia bacterium]
MMGKKIVFFTHGKVNPHEESGMSRIVYYRTKYLKRLGYDVEVISVFEDVDHHEIFTRDEILSVNLFPRIYIPWGFKHSELKKYLDANRGDIDIFDFNLMWFYDKVPVGKYLNQEGIPYIVTTHCAYSKDRIAHKPLKKNFAKYSYELPFLNRSSGVVAQTPEELSGLRSFGVSAHIYIYSNEIDDDEISAISNSEPFQLDGLLKLGWVGNITPVKNLHNLIKGIGILPESYRNHIKLYLVGNAKDKAYKERLDKLIMEYKLEDNVVFLGPKYREDKYRFLKSIDCYIHTSTSETILLAVLEAMAAGKPLIISRTSEVSYLYKYDFFVMVEPWYDHIAEGIMNFMDLNSKEREIMGMTAFEMVKSKFSVGVLIDKYVNIVNQVLNRRE